MGSEARRGRNGLDHAPCGKGRESSAGLEDTGQDVGIGDEASRQHSGGATKHGAETIGFGEGTDEGVGGEMLVGA